MPKEKDACLGATGRPGVSGGIHPFLRFAPILCLLVTVRPAPADEAAGVEYFEKKVRPLLVKHCYECHSADAKEVGGNLLLDHRDGVRKGGDSGPVVAPGKPDESLLIAAVRYSDDLKMPPTGKLPAAAIADLEAWVKLGAPDPRDRPAVKKTTDSWADALDRRRTWWSLQPVRKPTIPTATHSGGDDPVDRFIHARLEALGLVPAKAAAPRPFLRRLCLVLTGLPPTVEQTRDFLSDYESDRGGRRAIERLVDRLLASPRFGERWARHWMDVVRFTETHGNEWNYEVHHAWRYRDYLIRAFNADVPFDQFVREHIAGDLLSPPRWNAVEQINESVIGTSFLRFGEVNHDDCISLREIGFDIADNQIDTLSKAFQATTVACARCHDHKFDAVSMNDYYGLLGILRSSRLVSHTIDGPEVNASAVEQLRAIKGRLRKEIAALWLADADRIGDYLQASLAATPATGLDSARLEKWKAALSAKEIPFDDPLSPWSILTKPNADNPGKLLSDYAELAQKLAKESAEREQFNRAQFTSFVDFRDSTTEGWEAGGHGLQEPRHRSGDFVVAAEGDVALSAVLPAGCFTHALSSKLNGTLRSPILAPGKKNISFEVLGDRSSAVRLVSNNCQLNYKNYRALTSASLQWVTFSPPDDCDSLRTYAELMTMFDNPKFPDQLSALGGDKANYRLPWEKAAENPRSYFGITRVVLHDGPDPPKPGLGHLGTLFEGDPAKSIVELAARYSQAVRAAAQAFAEDQATDSDVRWIDSLLQRGLLSNQCKSTPSIEALINEYRQVEAALSVPRVIAGIGEAPTGYDQPVFVRGDCRRPGEPVPRRFLEVLGSSRELSTVTGSGRLELAEQIASPRNPLTARVMVNRVWHHLFGTGLVRTVDDFGHAGEPPSHPELLDYLAAEFAENRWSVKRLIRRIVLTQTFQSSSEASAAAREADPQHRLLQHYPARRMEAEAIRDSILAVSGRLSATQFGPSVQPFREREYADRRLFPGPLDGNGRRSVYIKNNLMESPQFLGVFNLPGGKVAQGRRDATNVPAQALTLLNDPFVFQQAEVWANRLIAEPHGSVEERIAAMFETALNRAAAPSEQSRFADGAAHIAELHAVSRTDILRSAAIWKDVAHAFFNLTEFVYIP